jgi:hypothetical protein
VCLDELGFFEHVATISQEQLFKNLKDMLLKFKVSSSFTDDWLVGLVACLGEVPRKAAFLKLVKIVDPDNIDEHV